MEEPLKQEIEELVDETLSFTLKDPNIKRVVVTDFYVQNNPQNRNHTYHRFLNKQSVINKEIEVKAIYPYNPLKDYQKGDYILYIDKWLKSNHSKVS